MAIPQVSTFWPTEVDTKSPGNAKTRLIEAFQGLQVGFEVTGDP
jgi:hypothetical protein